MVSAQYFVNSSLPLMLLLRRRIKSVSDVLEEIRRSGILSRQVGCFAR